MILINPAVAFKEVVPGPRTSLGWTEHTSAYHTEIKNARNKIWAQDNMLTTICNNMGNYPKLPHL